jgi:hypothetical protein
MWEDGSHGDDAQRGDSKTPRREPNQPRSEMEWKLHRPERIRSRRSVTNAFTRGGDGECSPRDRLAGGLAPLQAALEPTSLGWLLRLNPIQASDLFAALASADELIESLDRDRPRFTLVLMAESAGWDPKEGMRPLGTIARRLDVPVFAQHDDLIVLDDDALQQLLSVVPLHRIWAVRVDGPIEARDARAMAEAVDDGDSPLATELRAIAEVEVRDDRTSVIEARYLPQTLTLVAENFRHFLAAMCDRPFEGFGGPGLEQVHDLISEGTLTVRPIETQVYSTFIDVGICSTPDVPDGPANRSLIYDLPSGTWHDE